MPIHIRNEQKQVKVDRAALNRLVRKCLSQLNLSKAEISILLTDNETVKVLNHSHRGVNRPTDILSFGMREKRKKHDPLPPHPDILGDLVVAMPMVAQQAEQRGVRTDEELDFLIIHGILHLLGYDHASQKERLQMEGLHTALFQSCRPR